MAYVEHCCCERQLPKLLREKDIFFQTSGDVTVAHLMKAIGCMVENGSAMWLVIPDVDVNLLRTIRHWFSREWIIALHLLTNAPRHALVKQELDGCPNVEYAADDMITDGFLAFCGKENTVAVQGAMLLEKQFSTRLYAGWYGQRDGAKFDALLKPFASKMRVKGRL